MNGRELYTMIYAGERPTELPVYGIGGWAETLERWRTEGLGPEEDPNVALGLGHDHCVVLPLNMNMLPTFEIRVLEEGLDYVTLVDEYGVTKTMLRSDYDLTKGQMAEAGQTSSMSHWIDFPVKDMPSWKMLYEQRFQPTSEGRLPPDWKEQKPKFIEQSETSWVVCGSFPFGGLFSALRQLMGLEGTIYAIADNPRLIHTMVADLADFYSRTYALAVPEVRLDAVHFFEDMCSTKAPLISPAMFREFIAPGYRNLIGCLRDMGVQQFFIDTDGNAKPIIPELIANGFTGCRPCEVNAGMHADELRSEFPEFCLHGGIDKRALVEGGPALEAEVARRFETAWQMGRYTPALDHAAPPDISWANMQHYARLFLGWCKSPQEGEC